MFVSNSEDALAKVLKHGAEKIIFIGGKGFMDRNSHNLVDIPEAIDKLHKAHPSVKMIYVNPDIDIVCNELAKIIIAKVEDFIEQKGN